ncbi:MBL fold metallo-hydrolase [Mycolicibacterium sp. CH28]|uniref:MBL fold metallo-hydrolase n=1 Tax=Mycolicibacterium sp. CH28 TaxID=2512237 RepID=UPI00108055D3|nr:MBL fold metallo-hydrolase [Mycolicibacterium sp. CH28]TGD90345.1 MBL fold metallo-hydrolase [Mycolicibacterium sp. CH28]
MGSRIALGGARLTRVVETQVQMPTSLFAGTAPQAWADNADLLVPDFWDRQTDQWRIAMQSWVIEVDGLVVVVDTGVGNDRDRPHMPPLDHLSTDFLADFTAAGFDPAAVDVVVNTHLHTDHVGWNTQLVDGRWVPTFPNARYVMPEPDYRYFGPGGDGENDATRTVLADSVIPVTDQIQLWTHDLVLSDALRLRPAPGHTPGTSVLWLDAGRPAVFVGDLTHCPIQIRRPDDVCAFDVDPAAARGARRRVFGEAARANAVVIPAHYPGHGGATITGGADAAGFAVEDWLSIETI